MRPNDSTAFVQAGRPFAGDTIVRLYSMSKPLVSAAAMVLYERGDFQFDEHVSKRLPAFADHRSRLIRTYSLSNVTPLKSRPLAPTVTVLLTVPYSSISDPVAVVSYDPPTYETPFTS